MKLMKLTAIVVTVALFAQLTLRFAVPVASAQEKTTDPGTNRFAAGTFAPDYYLNSQIWVGRKEYKEKGDYVILNRDPQVPGGLWDYVNYPGRSGEAKALPEGWEAKQLLFPVYQKTIAGDGHISTGVVHPKFSTKDTRGVWGLYYKGELKVWVNCGNAAEDLVPKPTPSPTVKPTPCPQATPGPCVPTTPNGEMILVPEESDESDPNNRKMVYSNGCKTRIEVYTKEVVKECKPDTWFILKEAGQSQGKLGSSMKVEDLLKQLPEGVREGVAAQIDKKKISYLLVLQSCDKTQLKVVWFTKGGFGGAKIFAIIGAIAGALIFTGIILTGGGPKKTDKRGGGGIRPPD